MKKRSKRYKKLEELRAKGKKIEVKELIELIKKNYPHVISIIYR